jgi:inner membrane protein involved in colicin E2 resistance
VHATLVYKCREPLAMGLLLLLVVQLLILLLMVVGLVVERARRAVGMLDY